MEERDARETLLNRLGATDADLASNDRFAELLRSMGVEPPTKKKRPTAKTPNPVGDNYAFAKTDALFQAMLNGDREDVALLCEARLKVKSTTERTRAQRFLDIAGRGTLPVPLNYYGAATGRYTASRGSAINMQNLKRGSFLRKAIMAPQGHQLVVGDLSQIEPRVLAWLADYDAMLDIFRSGQDVYAQFGAQMFNTPGLTKESHPALRQSAKSALLGCLAGDTRVMTDGGYKRMLDVCPTDLLWDGCDWVSHRGLVPKGEKEVWTHCGLTATADHKILVGNTWKEWQEVHTNPSLFQQALSSATAPVSSGGVSTPFKQRMQTYDIAYAGPRNRYTILTDAGPLIVHNCGYGLGWASFAAQLLVGFLGAPPVRYDKAFAQSLGITAQDAEAFLQYEPNVTKMQEIAHTCTLKELVIHCLAAKAIIDKYRATATPVTKLWKLLEELIPYSLYGGAEYTHKCLTFRKEEIVLPSGMSIRYPDLRSDRDEFGRVQWTYGPDRTKLYAGKVANNITQGTARCVMTDGMLRVSKRYFVAGTVHDELLAVVPDAEVEDAKTWVLAQMTMEPSYMPGIPLAADGGAHRRYGEAKK